MSIISAGPFRTAAVDRRVGLVVDVLLLAGVRGRHHSAISIHPPPIQLI